MSVLVYVLMGLNGLLNVGNGLYMLVDPATWYVIVPTVTGTGPFNQHFIRDIGISHLLVGIGYFGASLLRRSASGCRARRPSG